MSSPPLRKRPRPSTAPPPFPFPTPALYTRSYMHRTPLTHIHWAAIPRILLTTSTDGILKLWTFNNTPTTTPTNNNNNSSTPKTTNSTLSFLRQFRVCHGPVSSICVHRDRAVVISETGVISFVDLGAVDLMAVVRIGGGVIVGRGVVMIGEGVVGVGVDGGKVGVVGVEGDGVNVVDVGHCVDVVGMGKVGDGVVSVDRKGMVECWKVEGGGRKVCKEVRGVRWRDKVDTDLYLVAKRRVRVEYAGVAPRGGLVVAVAEGVFSVFDVRSGKRVCEWEEGSLEGKAPEDMLKEFGDGEAGRRMAREREIVSKCEGGRLGGGNVAWDDSGMFILYGSAFGIKVVDVRTGQVVSMIGGAESSERFTSVAVCGFQPSKLKPKIENVPTRIVASAWNKSRVYVFAEEEEISGDRDVYNEQPSRIGAGEADFEGREGKSSKSKLAEAVTLHTGMGDIKVKLFTECRKTVENFVTLCKDGKYNNVLFHRVIDNFMLQTGDYEFGDGTGGVSCWGGTFEDEFFEKLRFDRAGTLGMANAGPATNGSQFFITTVATPHLDKKHTVFGRVIKGMDVVMEMQKVKTDKNDKPLTDIPIVSVSVHVELAD